MFYAVSAVLALFCAIALGLGPLVFCLSGLLAATVGFRARRPHWWGLPLALAGTAEAIGALAGWTTRSVLTVTTVAFALAVAARVAGRRAGHRMPTGRQR